MQFFYIYMMCSFINIGLELFFIFIKYLSKLYCLALVCVKYVLQDQSSSAGSIEFCENCRILPELSNSTRTVELCQNRRVLPEPSSSARSVEFCKIT